MTIHIKRGHIRDNLSAIVAPAANDDIGSGYTIGSTWINVSSNRIYICVDNASGAAVWDTVGGLAVTEMALSADPGLNAAVTTTIIDAYSGVIITLTGTGDAQTLQNPTDTTAGKKRFTVVVKGAFDIEVNGITMTGGEAQRFIWDGASWVAVTAVDADDIAATPHGDISATKVQTYLDELEDEKVKRIVSVDNEIARFDSTGGDIQGYSSNAPSISDDGRMSILGGGEIQALAAITSFAGTVSAASRAVTFSSTDDYDLCKIGGKVKASDDERIIVALPGSPIVTVDVDTTWGAATVIQEIQDPISQHKDSDGNVNMYVNPFGGIGLPGGNGNLQKGLVFGDGDSGLFENSDDALYVRIQGNNRWHFNSAANLVSLVGNRAGLRGDTNASATNPTLWPRHVYPATGIGSADADQLSLISGAIEAIRLSETTSKMVEKFACSALGGVGRVAFSATAAITAAHTITIQVNIPSGAKILGVQMRVDVALAVGETWNAQYVTGATQSIASAQAATVNTKANKFFDENAATAIASAETDITIQRSSNPGVDAFTAQGTIRAVVYYEDFTALGNV